MAAIEFTFRRRVEFSDTDMAGIMHFSNFFKFMEAAETAFLRSLGYSVAWVDADGRFGFPRVSVSCDYLAPVYFEDELTMTVTVLKLGTKSVTYQTRFSCGERQVALGKAVAVFCTHTPSHGMESLELPPTLRTALMPYLMKTEDER